MLIYNGYMPRTQKMNNHYVVVEVIVFISYNHKI
jgi:hypothetical protein